MVGKAWGGLLKTHGRIPATRKQLRLEVNGLCNSQGLTSVVRVHLPGRPPVPKVPEPLTTVPLAAARVFRHSGLEETLHIQTLTKCVCELQFSEVAFSLSSVSGGRTLVTLIRRTSMFISTSLVFLFIIVKRSSWHLFSPPFYSKQILFSNHIPWLQFPLPPPLPVPLHFTSPPESTPSLSLSVSL